MDYLAEIRKKQNESDRGYTDVDFAKAVVIEWNLQDKLRYPRTCRPFATLTAGLRTKAFLFRK